MANNIAPPVFSDTVNQEFFVEAQGGSQNVVSYLDRFPDSVYNKAIDSVLVKFLYALMGPAGAGALREQYLEARLAFEEAGLHTSDLDALYTSPFAFARLAEETYTVDASSALINSQDRARITIADANFRNRCIDFLKGARAGGTVRGFELVSKSALNRPVTVIENYKYLYDQGSDAPLGLPFYGTTTDLNEVIILPRPDVMQSSLQTLSISGTPTAGWFTLSYPAASNFQLIQVQTTAGFNGVVLPPGVTVSMGSYITITSIAGSVDITTLSPPAPQGTMTYAQAGETIGGTLFLTYPSTSAQSGTPLSAPSSGTFWAYLGVGQTVPLPYNATASQIQGALTSLSVIGNNNVSVTGGPFPSTPIAVQFTNGLANQQVLPLQFNTEPDLPWGSGPSPSGIGGPSALSPLVAEMTDVNNNPLTIIGEVVLDIAGISADEGQAALAPDDLHDLQVAIDEIRPITTIVTSTVGQSRTKRKVASTIFAGGAQTEVLRYETGRASVPWPQADSLHWIQPGVEREAPRPLRATQHQYWAFHNIAGIVSYTEEALSDPIYASPNGPFPSPTLYPRAPQYPGSSLYPDDTTYPSNALLPADDVNSPPLWVKYWDSHIGLFSPQQILLYPFLGRLHNATAQYLPPGALAPSPDPLVITTTLNQTGIINDEYPVDYLNLPGVPPLPTKQTFWASQERASGADYLEIDLGSVQAVNYVYFEATAKPFQIEIAYDVLDDAPQRNFMAVTLDPTTGSSTNLSYSATNRNPWQVVTWYFHNALGQMIYTRFLRIGFVRDTSTADIAAFLSSANTISPYSIEIRNLRIGRNVNTSSIPRTTT